MTKKTFVFLFLLCSIFLCSTTFFKKTLPFPFGRVVRHLFFDGHAPRWSTHKTFFYVAHFCVLWCFAKVLFSYTFLSLTINTHIIARTFVSLLIFECFVYQLAFMGLVVQPCKCMAWSPFYFPFDFSPLIDFCCPSNNIKVLWILFKSFYFSFLLTCWKKMFGIRYVFTIRGCQSSFWDPLSMFHPKTFIFTPFFPPPTDLFTPTCFFWHNPHACFWETFQRKLLRLPTCPLGAPACSSPHFSWED
jgi:hypothetical protein